MTKKVILVDVDQTVVNTATPWMEWLSTRTGEDWKKELESYQEEEDVPALSYDLSVYWMNELGKLGIDGDDFWRQRDLYDDLAPLPDAVYTLKQFHIANWDVVFVSMLKGDHHKSKYYFLKEWFPFMAGFIGTQEKSFVRGDILVDDRNKYLNAMPEDTLLCRMNTPYIQDEPLERGALIVDNWSQLEKQTRILRR